MSQIALLIRYAASSLDERRFSINKATARTAEKNAFPSSIFFCPIN
jgi:hypothetical protein